MLISHSGTGCGTGCGQHVVEDHRGSFTDGGIQLELELPVETGAEAGAVWVSGDPTRLAQAVGNLLTNAIKFTPTGGKASVAVWADAARGAACVRVQDSGRGIAPERLPYLFEAFTQLDVTLDRQKGGLGLGPYLVKGLVEMHGARCVLRARGLARAPPSPSACRWWSKRGGGEGVAGEGRGKVRGKGRRGRGRGAL